MPDSPRFPTRLNELRRRSRRLPVIRLACTKRMTDAQTYRPDMLLGWLLYLRIQDQLKNLLNAAARQNVCIVAP